MYIIPFFKRISFRNLLASVLRNLKRPLFVFKSFFDNRLLNDKTINHLKS